MKYGNIIRNPAIFFQLLIFLMLSCGGTKEEEKDPVAISEEYASPEETPVPQGTHSQLGLAGYAKVLCSAVFVSGRELDEAAGNSGYFFMPDGELEYVDYYLDTADQVIRLTLRDSISRSAKYHGDQGCIIQTEEGLFFEPVDVETSLPDAMSVVWPMGDKLPEEPADLNIDSVLLNEAVDTVFHPDAYTAAFVVVHKGQIIAERYMDGIDKDTQLESWSMGKSLTATLIGRMIKLGYFDLEDKAPVDAWSEPGDPRGEITIKDLLQMSSGLRFTSHRDPEVEHYERYLDHMYIYTGAVNAFEYSIHRPLQFPVGSEGRYRNCDPLTLGYIMRTKLESDGKVYWTWPQEELFDKIGIRRQVMETDPYGNFLLTGYDYGTARNWARLGMLYLQNGSWNGEQLLPENWSKFVSEHAPAWDEPVYGGLFWLNGNEAYPLPEDTYYMAGGGGQRTIIVPSLDLVIVRQGHWKGSDVSEQYLRAACKKIKMAISGSPS